MDGLDWKTIQIPLSKGLALKGDARAQDPPALEVLKDAEFDDIGGLRTRQPFSAIGTNIVGGGTLTNVRTVDANGSELICFTDTGLYSWIPEASAWALRATHLAVKVDQATRFATSDDQTECDRATLNGVTFVTWTDTTHANVIVAAYDSSSGAIIQTPVASSTFTTGDARSRPRLVALQTRVLLFCFNLTGRIYEVQAIDPASISFGAFTSIGSSGSTANPLPYDVCQIIGTDNAAFVGFLSPGTSYLAAKITSALVITTSTKARTADNVMGVSSATDGLHIQICRTSSTNVQGDLLLVSTLADVFTAQAIGTANPGTPITQIAMFHRSVKNTGQYRCYVFWSSSDDTTGGTSFSTQMNWVDDGGTIGSASVLRADLGIASKPFDYNGSIYINLAFGGDTYTTTPVGFIDAAVQNAYYLFRDDGFQAAKSVVGNAGGLSINNSESTQGLHSGNLPTVQRISAGVYAWCGMERRIIGAGKLSSTGFGHTLTKYEAHSPIEVTYTFDSNEARRVARIGRTLYVSGAEIQQYDGLNLVELGFNTMPWQEAGAAAGSAGHLSAGTYAIKATWRWDNAQGERDRSSSAAAYAYTATLNSTFTSTLVGPPLRTTKKPGVALEVWRTAVNPDATFPFYLITSQDQSVTSNPNRFLANVAVASVTPEPTLTDILADTSLTTNQLNPDATGVLENLAPPGGTILVAGDTRVFLAGIPSDPDRVWYSKQKQEDFVVAFNDALTTTIPQTGGVITAIAFFRGTAVVFRQTSTYALNGIGLDDTLGGQNYEAKMVSFDVGAVSQESVCVGPFGILFKSLKGWYIIDETFAPKYVGAGVAAFDGTDTILAATLVVKQHQVRIVTNHHILMWDYLVNEWGEWTVADGVSACLWGNNFVYLSSNTGPMQDSGSFQGTPTGYGLDVELAWLKAADLQGSSRIRWMQLLGEFRDVHAVRIRTAYDYEGDGNGSWLWRDDTVLIPTQTIPGSVEQMRRGLSRQQCEAVKFRLTAIGSFGFAANATASMFSAGGAITTSGANWAATFLSNLIGDLGNSIQLAVYTCSGTGIEIRDHQSFTPGGGWVAAPYVVGIRVGTDSQTVGALEAAIGRWSRMVTVAVHDATPANVIANSATLHTGFLIGGHIVAASGESLKLSGLAVEVGVKPGLYQKLAAAQKG